MRETALLLGVDIGTSAVDACAYSADGILVAHATSPLATSYPRPGWAEQDATTWADAALAALRQLAASLGPRVAAIVAIGLAGQCPTFTLVDDRGAPLTPGIIYQDNRATVEAEWITATLGARRYGHGRGRLPSHFSIAPQSAVARHASSALAPRQTLARPAA